VALLLGLAAHVSTASREPTLKHEEHVSKPKRKTPWYVSFSMGLSIALVISFDFLGKKGYDIVRVVTPPIIWEVIIIACGCIIASFGLFALIDRYV
jgi:hypothetical protein